jgi:hypothetical protein
MRLQTLGCDSEHTRSTCPHQCHASRIAHMHAAPATLPLAAAAHQFSLRTLRLPSPAGARVLQVMRLGSPVTSLSLGPAQDLLATTHTGKRGIYLWANQVCLKLSPPGTAQSSVLSRWPGTHVCKLQGYVNCSSAAPHITCTATATAGLGLEQRVVHMTC